MTRRTTAAALTAALALALTACGSQTGGSSGSYGGGGSGGSSSGGSSSSGGIIGGGDQFDPAPGDLGWGQGNTESGPMKEADTTTDAHGKTDSTFSDTVENCKVWFGVNPARSSEYLVSADRYGVAGHVQWRCSGTTSIARLHVDAKLRWALSPAGPWTEETGATANRTFTSDPGSGTGIVFTDECTTDYWQVGFRVRTEEAAQGPVTRPWIWSQWRKVTSEDCNRE